MGAILSEKAESIRAGAASPDTNRAKSKRRGKIPRRRQTLTDQGLN
jgi:hypothetical protein